MKQARRSALAAAALALLLPAAGAVQSDDADDQALLADADAAGLVDWEVSVDSTINRAHQHGTNLPRAEQVTGGPVESQESEGGAA